MKFLITGVSGQLGYDVKLELQKRGFNDILAPDAMDMDITDEDRVKSVILDYQPDVIFHCAAYTAVDKAEDNREICYDINVNGTKNIVKYSMEVGAKIIYISTDYVFNGSKDGYYEIDDMINPINYYGETKYLGEEEVRKYLNHIIVRISWVFGINGNNFIKSMLKLSLEKNELNVVCDQVGSPTYTVDLAKKLVDMAMSNNIGTYHATNDGVCSWYDFASYIFEVNNVDIKVNPISTSDYPTRAKRPQNSKLSKNRLIDDGFGALPTWQDAVKRYSKELKKIKKEEK